MSGVIVIMLILSRAFSLTSGIRERGSGKPLLYFSSVVRFYSSHAVHNLIFRISVPDYIYIAIVTRFMQLI